LAGIDERHRLFSYLEERFGISEKIFDEYVLVRRRRSWNLLKYAPQIVSAARLKTCKTGLKAFQQVGVFVKPTTRMIQVFGQAATKGALQIDERQVSRLLAGEILPVDSNLKRGYVILTLGETRVLGLGFLIRGRLHSQLPRKELRETMLQLD
jgi:NOL1/NOP2/fmu family ribosome biogenesis protein